MNVTSADGLAPVRWPFLALYVAALVGCYLAVITLSSLALAVRAGEVDPDNAAGVFSLTFGVGLIVSLPAAPIIGHLSDATRSRFGRRRPWIVIGSVVVMVSAWLLTLATAPWMLLLAWTLLSLANNAILVPLLSVIYDRVPERQRGLVSGLAGMTQGGAAVLCLGVTHVFTTTTQIILAPAAIALGLAVVFSFAFRSDGIQVHRERFDLRSAVASLRFNPRRAPQLAWALLFTFLVGFGMAPVTTFLYFFIQATLTQDPGEVVGLTALGTALTAGVGVLAAPISGRISDAFGRSKLVLVGGVAFIAAACVMFMLAHSIPLFVIAAATFGVGSGVLGGGTVALITNAVEAPDTAARDLGLGTLALSLPMGLVAAAQPIIVGVGGFTGMFLIGLVVPIVALLVLPRITVVR